MNSPDLESDQEFKIILLTLARGKTTQLSLFVYPKMRDFPRTKVILIRTEEDKTTERYPKSTKLFAFIFHADFVEKMENSSGFISKGEDFDLLMKWGQKYILSY